MGTVTEFTVDADAFALGQTLQEVPAMRVEGERMVTHSDEWVMPFLWAAGGAFEPFEAALDDDPTVAEFEAVNVFDGTRLYRIVWSDEIQRVLRDILDRDGALLEAKTRDRSWYLKIRFAHREQLSALQEYFAEHGGTFTLERLYEPTDPEAGTYNLTSEQREVLLLALDSGYFAIPRETTADELAAMLGITPAAVSERLRRAFATLVRNTLTFNQRPSGHTASRQPDE